MLVSTLLRLMMFASLISAVPSPKSDTDLADGQSLSAGTENDSEYYDSELDYGESD